MKAEYLRIGNFFQWNKLASMRCGVDVITRENHYKYEEFKEPTLLTEEWLLKFGFEENYQSAFRHKFDHPCNYIGYDFSKTPDKDMEGFRYYGKYVKCEYVHQLQNLYYALTGEELTIKQPA